MKREFGGRAEYCCIGVLCNVLEDNRIGNWTHEEYQFDEEYYTYDINRVVSDALGITDEQMDSYIDMNDKQRKTFVEIAAQVREDAKI